MSKIVYTKTSEDYTTGEVLSRTWVKRECKDRDAFARVYMEDIGALAKCSGAEQSVVLCCINYIDYNTNELILNSQRRKEICTCGNLKLNTVNSSISRLYRKNIFIRNEGKTFLNPTLFFYGSDIERDRLLELRIQYKILTND